MIDFRAWCNELGKYVPTETLYWDGEDFYAGEWECYENYIPPDCQKAVKIELATGFKDSKGEMTYDGDRIRSPIGFGLFLYHSVVWNDKLGSWFCLNEKSKCENDGDLQLFDLAKSINFEVWGNINKNSELEHD